MTSTKFWEILSNGLELAAATISHASPKDTHGPVVDTGPTAGQNRSRNKNGQWRKKRNDAGKPRK